MRTTPLALDDAQARHLLHSMVSIESFSGQEGRLARFLVGELASHGFEARLDGAGNAVGEVGAGPLTVALVGHMDTVPGDLPVVLQDDVLRGRGSVDAKGPLAAFVVAASRLAASGVPLALRVVGCVEEEAPSSHGARHLARDPAPDFLVVGEPSAWEGVTLGYKGYLRGTLALVDGVTHTAHQAPTVAARACDLWRSIQERAGEFNRGRKRLFDRILPALLEVACESDGTQARARLDLSLRLPPDLPPAAAEAWLREAAPEAQVTLVAEPLPAWSGPRTTDLARAFGRAVLGLGGRPRFQLKTGTADLNILAPAWGCPALAYGPGDAALDHTPDEHLRLDEFLRSIEVLVEALSALACRPVPAR